MKRATILLVFSFVTQLGISQNQNSIGMEIGPSSIIGDLESTSLQSFSLEFYYKKNLFQFLNYEPSVHLSRNFGLSENLFLADQTSPTNWFPAYKNTNLILFQNLSSSFRLITDRISVEPKIGIGLGVSSTRLNVLDENNRPYQNIEVVSGYSSGDPDYLSNILEIHDETYETETFQPSGLFTIGDNRASLYYNASVRLKYDITHSISIGLSHSVIVSDTDYLDGVKFRNENLQSNRTDFIQTSRISFEYRLSSE